MQQRENKFQLSPSGCYSLCWEDPSFISSERTRCMATQQQRVYRSILTYYRFRRRTELKLDLREEEWGEKGSRETMDLPNEKEFFNVVEE